MRHIGKLLSGTILALLVTTPIDAATAPDQIETAVRPVIAAPADTATPGTVATPAAAVDAQIADKLRAIVSSGQFDKRIERVPEREAMAAFYSAHNYAPLWLADGKLDARGKSVIAILVNAAADGLDPSDYQVPAFGAGSSPEALADADITLTYSVLLYARHLASGRVAPSRVLSEVDYGDHTPAPSDILKKLDDAADAGAALESYNPPHRGFLALKAKLAELRRNAARVESVETTAAKSRHGRRAEREPARLVATQAAIDRVIDNMERWRWLPRQLGETYVMVNVPDYTLKVVHDHQEEWRTKIVAGKPQTPTPLLSARMDNVLVNPSWHVPQSIIKNEYLPRYGRDPNIFARMGLEVKRNHDGTLSVTQPPGAHNALGRIKFNFENQFSVYLHDTPQKQLFAAAKRDFSHGCMRVENPTKFGEVVMRLAMNGRAPDAEQLAALFGRSERTFKLDNGPMVHLTYQTAFVDENGKLEFRDDVYGMDARIQAILHSDQRRIADLSPAQDAANDHDNPQANQVVLRRVERAEAADAFAYFDNLPDLPPRREQRHVAAHIRPQPATISPGFHSQNPSTPFPFLAIFGH